jgi:hypothetical protein
MQSHLIDKCSLTALPRSGERICMGRASFRA